MLSAQSYAQQIDQISQAMSLGNATLMAKQFDKTITLKIFSEQNIYSKQQAEQILKQFFEKNIPIQFSKQLENEQNGSKYYFGLLKTKQKLFRTYFYIKNTNSLDVIKEIRIEIE